MTRSTTTRRLTCPKAHGRRRVGTRGGSVVATCSTSSARTAPSRCAGWCTRKPIEPIMAEPATARPAICLNMIVRNEAHIVHEVLDAVAPYIASWVIVDTGSDDGTQDFIRNHMAGLGIPGELHERPWRNFAHNRSEALTLAQGRGDYIWIMDADDTLAGTPDFTRLDGDIYSLRYQLG